MVVVEELELLLLDSELRLLLELDWLEELHIPCELEEEELTLLALLELLDCEELEEESELLLDAELSLLSLTHFL